MKKINFASPVIDNVEKINILKALKSGWLAKGAYVERLEKRICQVLKSKYSISVNNGTSAMLLILMHLKIKRNDEIIVPSLCYVSPIHMIKLMGALPIVADVNLKTFQIDYKKIIQLVKKINLHFNCDFNLLAVLRIFIIRRILESPYGTSIVIKKDKDTQVEMLRLLSERQHI